jgi:hypothetical protein
LAQKYIFLKMSPLQETKKYFSVQKFSLLYRKGSVSAILPREGIHEHNIDKRLEYFALCYSQLLLLADFTPSYGFLRLEFSTVAGRG